MNNNQNNQKIIVHFDVQQVVVLTDSIDKDLFIYDQCAKWMWGQLEKNNKDNNQQVTGWRMTSQTLSQKAPQQNLISYKTYLEEYLKPTKEEQLKILQNLTKGVGAAVKSDIDKMIRNITLPKTLAEAISQSIDPNNKLINYYSSTGKYQILPAFFKFILTLKKSKRQFAIIIKNSNIKENHHDIINELNLFFGGEHPLFNGKNGTPLVKLDGSKGSKNYLIEETHQTVLYSLGDKQLFGTYGTLNTTSEKDPEMFKQKFKSFKNVKLCEGLQQIYTVSHSLLATSFCIYEINTLNLVVIDPLDYSTHQIYFTNSDKIRICSNQGEQIQDQKHYIQKVQLLQYLKDVDYFIKKTQILEGQRILQISRISRGESQIQDQQNNLNSNQPSQIKQSNYAYLKKHLLPVLQGALRQVDIIRPQDPIAFIALYCLKNQQRLS